MSTLRGIRNFNPGNIERNSKNHWQGRMPTERMTAEQRRETRFEVFASAVWGIRALCIVLINYQDKHGCNTIQQLINRWAPPSENDTAAYVAAVAGAVGIASDARINTHQFAHLRPLVEAIIKHENAGYAYSADVIEEGLRLAGVVKPNVPLVAQPKAAQAATVTALTAGGTAAVVEGVNQLLPALQSMNAVAASTGALPGPMRALVTLAVLVSVAASFYAFWRLRCARKAVQP